LLDRGDAVTALGTRDRAEIDHPNFTYIRADTTQPGRWQEAVSEADLLFNLAGQTISHRWTKNYKQAMVDSRILTTRHLVSALPASSSSVLISASAIGYYGDGRDVLITEEAPNGDDFLARLSKDWEAEARIAMEKGVRVVIPRLGIVLGKDGGALNSMLPAFRAFVGGPIGSGLQWFSWIHLDDLIAALLFVAQQSHLQGPVNLCAPHPVRNAELAKVLGSVLGRPAGMPVPATVLKLTLGEFAKALLAGQRVVPRILVDAGFEFHYPELRSALTQILT
jgi:uncharacterized protein (TIGR01777 family)